MAEECPAKPISLELWDSLEARFRANLYDGAGQFGEIARRDCASRFVLAAPHAVNHHRDGAVKLAERWTGSLAEILASHLGCGYVIATGAVPVWQDWSTRRDAFRLALDELASEGRFIADLHGMSDTYGVDLCIGLGPRPGPATHAFATRLQDSMGQYRVAVNTPFSAQRDYTVTSYVQQHTAGDAVQLEIAARYRDPASNTEQACGFARDLAAAINDALEDGVGVDAQ